jgi:hypothetical protein
MAKPASGMYKTKARNLTDAQLKRAKGAGAAGKRTVSVSATSRATTGANKGFTLGPGGKRLTGTVVMANGDRAVYKGGKRVTNAPKASVKRDLSSTPRTDSNSDVGGTKNSVYSATKKKTYKNNTVGSSLRESMPNKPKSITNSNRVSPSRRGEGSQLIWNENTKKWMVK